MAAHEMTNDHADWTSNLVEMILFKFAYRFHRACRGARRPKAARIAGMVNISQRPAEADYRASY